MPLGNEDKWEMNEDDSHLRNAVARSPKVLRYSLSDVCPHFPCEKRGNFYQASSSISFVMNSHLPQPRQLIPPSIAVARSPQVLTL